MKHPPMRFSEMGEGKAAKVVSLQQHTGIPPFAAFNLPHFKFGRLLWVQEAPGNDDTFLTRLKKGGEGGESEFVHCENDAQIPMLKLTINILINLRDK